MSTSFASQPPVLEEVAEEVLRHWKGDKQAAAATLLDMGLRLPPLTVADEPLANAVLQHCGDRTAAAAQLSEMGLRLPEPEDVGSVEETEGVAEDRPQKRQRQGEIEGSEIEGPTQIPGLKESPVASATHVQGGGGTERAPMQDSATRHVSRSHSAAETICEAKASGHNPSPTPTMGPYMFMSAGFGHCVGSGALQAASCVPGAPAPVCTAASATALASRMRRFYSEGGPDRAKISIVYHWTGRKNFRSIDERNLQVPGAASKVQHATDEGYYGKGIYTSPEFSMYKGYGDDSRAFVCLALPGRQFPALFPDHLGAPLEPGYDSHISGDDNDGPRGTQWVFFSADQLLSLFLVDEKGVAAATAAASAVASYLRNNLLSAPNDALPLPVIAASGSKANGGGSKQKKNNTMSNLVASRPRACAKCGGVWDGCSSCSAPVTANPWTMTGGVGASRPIPRKRRGSENASGAATGPGYFFGF